MDLGLRGKTAIVCGASSGLGLASAEALADEGANVAMFARRRDELERDAERIGAGLELVTFDKGFIQYKSLSCTILS